MARSKLPIEEKAEIEALRQCHRETNERVAELNGKLEQLAQQREDVIRERREALREGRRLAQQVSYCQRRVVEDRTLDGPA